MFMLLKIQDDTLFQFDYSKFEHEAKIFDEKIFKK